MGTFKKRVVCLTLLLTGLTLLAAGLAILPRSGFAEAEPASDVFPEVFGVKLGGDILDYPGMEPSRPFADGSTVYERKSDKGLSFAGIPVTYSAYIAYENRISRIYFCIDPDNLEKMVTHFVTTYGEFTRDEDGFYLWRRLYFDVDIELKEPEKECIVTFRHRPLLQKRKSEHMGIHGLEYNNIYLNEPIAKYKGEVMLPYSFLNPDMYFAPGYMDYRRFVEDTWLGGPGSTVIYQTWMGKIYKIKIFFAMERYDEVLAALREKYKQWDSEFKRDNRIDYWALGEYRISLGQLEKEPENGMVVFTYWPLCRQANAVERLSKSISGLAP